MALKSLNHPVVRILLCSLLLVALFIGITALTPSNAHAAATKVAQKYNVLSPSNEKVASQANSSLAPLSCNLNTITYNNYWWGTEIYLPPCAAALAAAGFSVIPVVGAIGAAAIAAAIAISCNGSIYIDEVIGGPTYPRPAC